MFDGQVLKTASKVESMDKGTTYSLIPHFDILQQPREQLFQKYMQWECETKVSSSIMYNSVKIIWWLSTENCKVEQMDKSAICPMELLDKST